MMQLLITVMLGLCGICFVFGDQRLRALLAVLSLFVAAFEVEFGIGLNLPSLLAILSGCLLLVGNVGVPARCTSLFGGRLLLFFLWALGVWLVGYYNLASLDNAQHGWTRGSTIKPIVQFVRFLLFIPFALVIADGLRQLADFRWLLTAWAKIAVVSALICIAQVGVHKTTGKTIGIYNAHKGTFRTTQARIAGIRLMRANGFAGEPKAQGMAMAISLCMLVGAWDRRLLLLSQRQHLFAMALVATGLMLTFSTGAFMMTVILVGLVLINQQGQSARRLAFIGMFAVALAVLCFPNAALSLWNVRLQKAFDLAADVRGEGWGMDKERPAMIYLLDNPGVAITGVGVGIGPYHFDQLIPLPQFRGKYVDPNSGVLWSLYGFGAIGSALLLGGLWPEIWGTRLRPEASYLTTILVRFALAYFLVYTPLWWLMLAIGLSCSPAAQLDLRVARTTALTLPDKKELLHAA